MAREEDKDSAEPQRECASLAGTSRKLNGCFKQQNQPDAWIPVLGMFVHTLSPSCYSGKSEREEGLQGQHQAEGACSVCRRRMIKSASKKGTKRLRLLSRHFRAPIQCALPRRCKSVSVSAGS